MDVLLVDTQKQRRADYVLGLVFVLLVVVVWVGSSELIQYIFSSGFDSPFFLTFVNTGLFTVYLLSAYMNLRYRALVDPLPTSAVITHDSPLAYDSLDFTGTATSTGSVGVGSRSRADSIQSSASSVLPVDTTPDFVEIAKTAAILCPLWFGLNYTFNWSLSSTSLASNTILSTTSGLSTMILSYFLLKTPVRLYNVAGVLFTLGGAVCVGLSDSTHSGHDTFWGDFWCLVSAVLYATYTVTLRIRVPEDNALNMQILFGFVGLFNVALLWPGFLIVNAVGLEPFEWPSASTWGFLLLNGFIGTVFSDYIWARAVVLTSPLIATLGLTLTIPLAMVVDLTINRKSFPAVYILGSVFVVCGFVLVNWRFSQEHVTDGSAAEKQPLRHPVSSIDSLSPDSTSGSSSEHEAVGNRVV